MRCAAGERRRTASSPIPFDLPPLPVAPKANATPSAPSGHWHQPQTRPASPSGSPSAAARADAGISSRPPASPRRKRRRCSSSRRWHQPQTRPASPRRKRKRCTAAIESSSSVRRAPREPAESEDKMQEARESRSARSLELLWEKSRRRPTLPHGYPCSTIGSEELNFRVRDGIGGGLFEITTGNCGSAEPRKARARGRLSGESTAGGPESVPSC